MAAMARWMARFLIITRENSRCRAHKRAPPRGCRRPSRRGPGSSRSRWPPARRRHPRPPRSAPGPEHTGSPWLRAKRADPVGGLLLPVAGLLLHQVAGLGRGLLDRLGVLGRGPGHLAARVGGGPTDLAGLVPGHLAGRLLARAGPGRRRWVAARVPAHRAPHTPRGLVRHRNPGTHLATRSPGRSTRTGRRPK